MLANTNSVWRFFCVFLLHICASSNIVLMYLKGSATVDQQIRKQAFKHFSGYNIATYFDVETGVELFGPRQFFEYMVESEGPSQNSIDAAVNDLGLFLRYLRKCSELQFKGQPWMSETGTYLNRILLMYPLFLAEADSSPNTFIAEIAKQIGFTGLREASVRRYISTVNQFVKFNNSEWVSQKALADKTELDVFVSEKNLLIQLSQSLPVDIGKKEMMLNNSMLAGVISGGPRKMARPVLKMPRRFRGILDPVDKKYNKCFPIDRVLDLIRDSSTYRDICFFSLLAGTGIRTSEAVQMRLEDVDVEEETVKILPYSIRIKAYSDINENQIAKLVYKGRSSEDVYFLEPFKTIFFSNLLRYITEERDRSDPSHDFLFVTLAKNIKGRAMFEGDATSHNRTFKATQARIGMEKKYSLHSLRHFYGTWLRNYAPNNSGYGYPIEVVQKAMGHQNSKTTEGYALPDKYAFIKKIAETNKKLKELGFNLNSVKNLASEQ